MASLAAAAVVKAGAGLELPLRGVGSPLPARRTAVNTLPSLNGKSSGVCSGRRRGSIPAAAARTRRCTVTCSAVAAGTDDSEATYSAGIVRSAQEGQPEEALKLWESMRAAGLAPAAPETYSALFRACDATAQPGNDHAWQKALEVRNVMAEIGLNQTTETYDALIDTCEKCGQWEKALDLFEEMRLVHVAPDATTFRLIKKAKDTIRLLRSTAIFLGWYALIVTLFIALRLQH
eukprot:jgi/Chlat1/7514/Chrsp61S07021